MKNPIPTVRAWSSTHKFGSVLIVAVVIVGGFGMYRSATTAKAATQYVLSPVTVGSIIQTVTGSGQVSAANQIDVTSQASGAITSIDVSVGQHVHAGDLLATIDDTNALNALNNAKLSFAQLTEPAKPGDIANAVNAVAKSYTDGYSSVSGTFTDLQTIMPGLNDMLYGQTGFLSDQRSTLLSDTGQNYRETAGQAYDKANAEYGTVLTEYKSLNRQSATSSIAQLITDAYGMARDVSTALQNTQNAITWISNAQPKYDPTGLATAEADATSWSNSVNGDVSSLSGASDTIVSSANSLYNLETGADPLAVQAGQISLAQAQQTYDDYFIRAPFDGVIGRIPAALYSQAGDSTVIATVVGDQKLANISLDEVDAANVKVGQKVTVSFDAINNFTATGTVSEVDLVGTVSGGVVSFGVKIAINTVDPRILPGMSLNVTIITNELDGVTIVPTAAVKASGKQSYVQTIDPATVRAYMQKQAAASGASGRTGSTTRNYSGTGSGSSTRSLPGAGTGSNAQSYPNAGGAFSSTTGGSGGAASSTRSFSGLFAGSAGGTGRAGLSVTMPSATSPSSVNVTVGQSDSTNIQILSGLTPGQWVVTRTIAGSAASTATAAPSLLSSLGARAGIGGGGGGGARPTAAPAAAARPAGN